MTFLTNILSALTYDVVTHKPGLLPSEIKSAIEVAYSLQYPTLFNATGAYKCHTHDSAIDLEMKFRENLETLGTGVCLYIGKREHKGGDGLYSVHMTNAHGATLTAITEIEDNFLHLTIFGSQDQIENLSFDFKDFLEIVTKSDEERPSQT